MIASVCQGCGTCAAACPASAITLKGFTNDEIYSQIEAPFKKSAKKEVAAGAPA